MTVSPECYGTFILQSGMKVYHRYAKFYPREVILNSNDCVEVFFLDFLHRFYLHLINLPIERSYKKILLLEKGGEWIIQNLKFSSITQDLMKLL